MVPAKDKEYSANGSLYAFLAVAILIIACAALMLVNQRLREQNTALVKQYRALVSTEGPQVGSKIASLHGTSVAGKTMTLDLSKRSKGALILVFSPTCPHCKANFHNWQSLMHLIPNRQIIWVDVTDTATASYLSSHAIPSDSPVIRVDAAESNHYAMDLTPTTIWLNAHGVVKHVWLGELHPYQMAQIQKVLKSSHA